MLLQLSNIQMVFDKMTAICLDLDRISDLIQNPDHLQKKWFQQFEIRTSLEFRSLLYIPALAYLNRAILRFVIL